jgi:aspartate carbamoyltransferase catalytic subunit
MKKDFISIDDLSRKDIIELVDLSKFYKRWYKRGNKRVGGLEGRTIINAFFEPSTRTRSSFEASVKRMGADVINFIADASSLLKDETLEDTVRVLDAMSADALIIRTKVNNLPQRLSPYASASIINAGDGTNEHPSQALLDYFTMMEAFDFDHDRPLTVAIIGDILHSRVANSNILMLLSMRNTVRLVGPNEWLPNRFDGACEYYSNVLEAIQDADVVMTLRVQKERINNIPQDLSKMEMDKNNNMPSFDHEKYNRLYGIKRGMLSKEQLLLHPGPVNHNVELDNDMVYCQNSKILTQVENGVASRSAVLDFLFRG